MQGRLPLHQGHGHPGVHFTQPSQGYSEGEVLPPAPATVLHEARGRSEFHASPPRGLRDNSVSPGAESRGTASYSVIGEEEKVILNSVIARLQHGIDLSGQRAQAQERLQQQQQMQMHGGGGGGGGGQMHVQDPSVPSAQTAEMRVQLDRAGILIGQQLETSARKDVLLQQVEAFAHIEKLHLQMQLETMYDHLTSERDHYCMQEQQLQRRIDTTAAATEHCLQDSEAMRADYEERLRAMSMAHSDALEELEKKGNEHRKEQRQELQEGAERLSDAISSSEQQRREEKQTRDDEAETLAFYSEELEARNAILCEALEDSFHLHVISEQTPEQPAPHVEEEEEEEQTETPGQLIASLQEEVASLREQLEDSLQTLQSRQDEDARTQEEKLRLASLVEGLEQEVESCREEFAVKSLELESNLLVMGGGGAVVLSKDSSFYLEELLQARQDAGRYFIMLQQLQELMCFVLQRYAPHWSSEEEDLVDVNMNGEEGFGEGDLQYRGIYPSYWGWLYKSTGMFVSWQRRFFVIRDGVLKLSNSGDVGVEEEWGNSNSFKTVLRVESIAKVELESFQDAAQGNHPPTGKYESFGFMVETYSRQRIKFCCTSSSERAEWMNILRRCNDIRLNNERFRSYGCEGQPAPEPYLYLEYCSPPDPPPSYRTRVRMNEAGAYPMVGPGSPPRAYLNAVPQYAAGSVPSTKQRREAREHSSPPPPRPVLIQGEKSTPRKGRKGTQQVGGASGVGRQHRMSAVSAGSPGAASNPPRSAVAGGGASVGGTTPLKRSSRRTSTTTQPSPGSMHSVSEVGADPFEGTVPLDVLLVKAPDEGLEDEEGQVRATAHSFFAKFQGSYGRIQLFYCDHTHGCVLASAVYKEVLGVADGPTMMQSEPSGVMKLLNNMAAQPAVPGSPESVLIILISSDSDACVVDQLAAALTPQNAQVPHPLPLNSATLFSSLYTSSRNGVSWEFVTLVDGK